MQRHAWCGTRRPMTAAEPRCNRWGEVGAGSGLPPGCRCCCCCWASWVCPQCTRGPFRQQQPLRWLTNVHCTATPHPLPATRELLHHHSLCSGWVNQYWPGPLRPRWQALEESRALDGKLTGQAQAQAQGPGGGPSAAAAGEAAGSAADAARIDDLEGQLAELQVSSREDEGGVRHGAAAVYTPTSCMIVMHRTAGRERQQPVIHAAAVLTGADCHP